MSYYKPGTWNVICQLCGCEFKSDEIRKRWDGLLVCQNDYETRHILDFFRPRTESSTVPFTSPEPKDIFTFSCPYPTTSATADVGTADCAVAGYAITSFVEVTTAPIAGIAKAGGTLPTKGTNT